MHSDEAFVRGIHSFAKQIYEDTANRTYGTEGCDKIISFFHEHWPSFVNGRGYDDILFNNHNYIIRQKYNPGGFSIVARYIDPNQHCIPILKIN